MPFLPPNQQRQSTEGRVGVYIYMCSGEPAVLTNASASDFLTVPTVWLQLKKRCNSSDVCVVRLLDYLKFPRHLKDCAYMHAYQPVVIQVAVNVTFDAHSTVVRDVMEPGKIRFRRIQIVFQIRRFRMQM